MNPLERGARWIDDFQQRHVAVAVPFAVVKKFGDDEGGRLAALIAYYGFFSLFPLLLVLVSVLGYVLAGHPGLRNDIIDSAFAQFPVIGRSLRAQAHVDQLHGNVVAVVIGAVTALWAEGDEEVYRGIVERARMRPEVAVDVWFTDNQEKGAGGRSGAELPEDEPADADSPAGHAGRATT